jgi:hypothetical protein
MLRFYIFDTTQLELGKKLVLEQTHTRRAYIRSRLVL